MAEPIIVLDPDKTVAVTLTTVLGSLGIESKVYPDVPAFEQSLAETPMNPACVLLEGNLAESCGPRLYRRFPTIVMAAGADDRFTARQVADGAVTVLQKPLATWPLLTVLNRLMNDSPGLTAALPRTIVLDDGRQINIRGIQPEDAGIEQDFVRSLSLASKQKRFFFPVKELSAKMLHDFTHSQYPENWALIATVMDDGKETEIGVARYAPSRGAAGSEFAVVVADAWQGRGVATHLMRELLGVAEQAGIKLIEGVVLRENRRMLAFVEGLGFISQPHPDDPGIVSVAKVLGT